MKKIVVIMIGVLISSMLGMTVGMVSARTTDTIVDKLFEEADVDKSYKNDEKELEKLSEDKDLPFNNLYLFVYQNVKEGPKEAAIDQLVRETDYNENELEKILFESDVDPIIDRHAEKVIEMQTEGVIEELRQKQSDADVAKVEELEAAGLSEEEEDLAWFEYYTTERITIDEEGLETQLTQSYILEEYSALSDRYEAELEFQTENKMLAFEALASEMFMNGDKGDSAGVDLLYDLDMINKALFGYEITYPDRSAGTEEEDEEVELSSIEEDARAEARVVVLAEEENEEEACFEDEELRAALDDYGEGDDSGGESYVPTSGDIDLGDDDDDDDNDDDEEDKDFEEMLEELSVEPGDWSRGLPCNDIFCIVINLVTEDNSPEVAEYEETDNCIACHVAYINKRLDETMSKSLVPSKITMNWFEDATCKGAGLLATLDLHVYAVPQPITLDPEDDTDDYAQERAENLSDKLEAAESRYGTKTQADYECEAILNMNDVAGTPSSIEDSMVDCEDAGNAVEASIAEIQDEFIFESQSQVNSTLYEQVSNELSSMYLYFNSFKLALQNSYKTDETPLKSIISKGYCQ